MIDIAQHRSVIGAFASVCYKQKQVASDAKEVEMDQLYDQYQHWTHVLLGFWKHYLLQYLGIHKLINELIIKLRP